MYETHCVSMTSLHLGIFKKTEHTLKTTVNFLLEHYWWDKLHVQYFTTKNNPSLELQKALEVLLSPE